MSRLASPQARELRHRLVVSLLVMLVVYTVAFAVFAVAVQALVVPALSRWVADATSEWTYMDWPTYMLFMKDAVSSGRHWDAWAVGDGMFGVRNLDTYDFIKSFKVPLAVGLYLAGCFAIVVVVLRRSLRYFDDLSLAVRKLIADKTKPVELPDELSITRSELMAVRENALADDRVAKAAEARKDELVAYLAHDIKTPLTSVIGYLSLLQESPDLPAETRERYARVALEKAERLDGLMDEFFEITRYNLKSMPIERERIDVGMLCAQVADELFPEADARGVGLETSCPEGMRAFADPDKMARALSNVARNAVAFADRASVVKIAASLTVDGKVCIDVTDEGKEISEVHLESIFEKFFREDGARSTSRGGAGLGLAIAREIVRAHGGDITAKSERGITTFSLVFPQMQA